VGRRSSRPSRPRSSRPLGGMCHRFLKTLAPMVREYEQIPSLCPTRPTYWTAPGSRKSK
jgi:hypothetical protein